jgi:hypothetical protein
VAHELVAPSIKWNPTNKLFGQFRLKSEHREAKAAIPTPGSRRIRPLLSQLRGLTRVQTQPKSRGRVPDNPSGLPIWRFLCAVLSPERWYLSPKFGAVLEEITVATGARCVALASHNPPVGMWRAWFLPIFSIAISEGAREPHTYDAQHAPSRRRRESGHPLPKFRRRDAAKLRP